MPWALGALPAVPPNSRKSFNLAPTSLAATSLAIHAATHGASSKAPSPVPMGRLMGRSEWMGRSEPSPECGREIGRRRVPSAPPTGKVRR